MRYRVREARSSVIGSIMEERSGGSVTQKGSCLLGKNSKAVYIVHFLIFTLLVFSHRALLLNVPTIIWLDRHSTYSPTHGHKTTEVFLQTFIRLFVKPGKGSKLVPVKLLFHRVKNNPKGRYHTVKISLFSSCPPVRKIILACITLQEKT